MTLFIMPLNSPSTHPQLPTLPLFLPTTWNHSTTPSSATSGINSGIPFPPKNSDLLKKNLFFGLLQIELFPMKKFFSPGSESHIHASLTFTCISVSSLLPLVNIVTKLNLSVEPLFSCPTLTNVRHSHSVSSILSTALSNNQEVITRSLNYLRSIYSFASIQNFSSSPSR